MWELNLFIDYLSHLWYKCMVSYTDVKVRNLDMAARGVALLGRLVFRLLVLLFIVMCLVASINLRPPSSMPGSSGVPDTPKVDQTMMDKATASTAGQDLKRHGYAAKS